MKSVAEKKSELKLNMKMMFLESWEQSINDLVNPKYYSLYEVLASALFYNINYILNIKINWSPG